jgi:hypothetical protein
MAMRYIAWICIIFGAAIPTVARAPLIITDLAFLVGR